MSNKAKVEHVVLTFVGAFLASWVVSGDAINKDALLAAVAAGVVAAWHVVVVPTASAVSAKLGL